MVTEIRYINIREVLSRVLRHPLLQDVTLEQAIQYTIDFIGIFGLPHFYTDKEADIEIKDFKGELPCDLIRINMVKDLKSDLPLRSMTSMFNPGGRYYHELWHEPQFKTQGRTIFTSFKCGVVHISYKAIPVDDEGLPLLIDHPKYLKALELYIRCQAFSILFDLGKITQQVLNHTEQEYGWAAGQLSEEFSTPSVSEMESITNILNQMLVRKDEFIRNFETLGNKEHKIVHNNGSRVTGVSRNLHRGPIPPPYYLDETGEDCECTEYEALSDDDIDRIINQPII